MARDPIHPVSENPRALRPPLTRRRCAHPSCKAVDKCNQHQNGSADAVDLLAGRSRCQRAHQWLGVLSVVLAAFAWASTRMDEPQARAFAFATLVVGNLALILANRSATRSLWATLHTPNALLWAVMGLATALLLIALYQPWVAGVLRFAPLPLMELALACGLGMLSVFWFEGVKRLRQGAR